VHLTDTLKSSIDTYSFDNVWLSVESTNEATLAFLTEVTQSGDHLSQDIDLSANKVKVNSSKFNTSANITLYSITYTDPGPTVAYDDATFVTCPSNVCTELNYSAGAFSYNVTHFTTYSSKETYAPTPTPTTTGGGGGTGGCFPVWECTGWSACSSSGSRTRTCSVVNGCTHIYGFADKPSERETCTYVAPKVEAPTPIPQVPPAEEKPAQLPAVPEPIAPTTIQQPALSNQQIIQIVAVTVLFAAIIVLAVWSLLRKRRAVKINHNKHN